MRKKITPLITASLLLTTCSSLLGQDDDGEVFELSPFEVNSEGDIGYRAANSVSMTRTNTALHDLPISVSVVTSSLIEDTGALELEDTANYVSNVNLGGQRSTSGVSANLFTIRGFASGLVLRNGNVQNFRFGDLAFVDRVEIIKGPTSLYGETSPGGFTNVTTKKAQFTDFTTASFQVGSYDHFRTTLDVNRKLNDKTAVRVLAVHQSNEEDEQNIENERNAFLLNLIHTPDDKTRLWFDMTYQDDDGNQQRNPFPFESVTSGDPIDLPDGFTLTNSGDTSTNEDIYFELGLERSFSESLSAQLTWSHNELERRFHTTFNGAFASVDEETGLFRVPRWPGVDYVDLDADTISGNLLWLVEQESFKNEMILSVRDSSSETLGGNFIYFGDVTESFPEFSPFKLITDDQPESFSDFNVSVDQIFDFLGVDIDSEPVNKSRTRVYGITDRISFMDDKLSFLAGVRRTEIDTPSITEDTFQLGGNYKVSKGVSLFAGYAEGFQSNGFDNDNNVRPPLFSESLEFGFKFDLVESGLGGHIAHYTITQKNIVNQGIFGVDGVTETVSGEQESNGIEVEFYYTPVGNENLSFIFGYFNQDADVTSELGVVVDDEGNSIEEDRSGRTLMGSSPNGLNIWSKYKFVDGPLAGLSVSGGFWWREGPIPQFPDYNRRELVQEDDINGVDLTLGYETVMFGKDTYWSLNIRNVTDEYYLKQRGLYSDPIAVKLSARINF
ncbi:TonB-dependent receptor plug domain-containing protein [Puniceicoccaceae bacterium K14]|nr:TonB-dependent receptor plug domain-containing protein [Puniceicoccaceae bacterium K14]